MVGDNVDADLRRLGSSGCLSTMVAASPGGRLPGGVSGVLQWLEDEARPPSLRRDDRPSPDATLRGNLAALFTLTGRLRTRPGLHAIL
jgi:hypothetical protein